MCYCVVEGRPVEERVLILVFHLTHKTFRIGTKQDTRDVVTEDMLSPPAPLPMGPTPSTTGASKRSLVSNTVALHLHGTNMPNDEDYQ